MLVLRGGRIRGLRGWSIPRLSRRRNSLVAAPPAYKSRELSFRCRSSMFCVLVSLGTTSYCDAVPTWMAAWHQVMKQLELACPTRYSAASASDATGGRFWQTGGSAHLHPCCVPGCCTDNANNVTTVQPWAKCRDEKPAVIVLCKALAMHGRMTAAFEHGDEPLTPRVEPC